MRMKCFAIVLAAVTAVLCVPAGAAIAAQGEFVYTLEDGTTESIVDPLDGECTPFLVDNGLVEAVNNTDRVAELSTGCANELESDEETAADDGIKSVADLQPGESYRRVQGGPTAAAVNFASVRSKNTSTTENPDSAGEGPPLPALDPAAIAPR